MANYELVLVDRTPQSTGGPTLTDVGPLIAPSITYTDELDGDGRLNCSVAVEVLDEDIKTALRLLADPSSPPDPLEVNLYRDGVLSWAGPVVGGQVQSGTLTLDARGLAYYLRYWYVTSDLTYTATDQFAIATGLVNHWQALTYGDVGIDTSGVGASGVTRDRTYLAAEQPNIYEKVRDLSEVSDGFDWWITADRTFHVSSERGTDRTGTVVFDQRNVVDPGIAFSVASEDVASEAFGLSTDSIEDPLTSTQANTAMRSTFGRTGVAGRFDGVTVQTTLDGHTQKLLDDRSGALFLPGPKLLPVTDVGVGDFAPGDTIQWSFDAGLGTQTFNRRLSTVQVSVDVDGAESLSLGVL